MPRSRSGMAHNLRLCQPALLCSFAFMHRRRSKLSARYHSAALPTKTKFIIRRLKTKIPTQIILLSFYCCLTVPLELPVQQPLVCYFGAQGSARNLKWSDWTDRTHTRLPHYRPTTIPRAKIYSLTQTTIISY